MPGLRSDASSDGGRDPAALSAWLSLDWTALSAPGPWSRMHDRGPLRARAGAQGRWLGFDGEGSTGYQCSALPNLGRV